MFRNLKFALTCFALLSACATEEGYRQVVNTWIGAHADQLVSVWGPPQSAYPLSDGGEVLQYDAERQVQSGGYTYTTYQPVQTYSSGTVNTYSSGTVSTYSSGTVGSYSGYGYGNYSGTSTTYVPVTNTTPVVTSTYRCVTRFTIDSQKIIRSVSFQGNDCRAVPPDTSPKEITPEPSSQTAKTTGPQTPKKTISQAVETTETGEKATSSVSKNGRDKIYDLIMYQMSKETVRYGKHKGKKISYRSHEKNKALAVCISWYRSEYNEIYYMGWGAGYGAPSKNISVDWAMDECRRSEKDGCQCQVVDQNDENVLEVPDTFLARYLSRTPSNLSVMALSSRSNDDICRLAVPQHAALTWDDRPVVQNAVKEAKRRRLTPEACAKLLGL